MHMIVRRPYASLIKNALHLYSLEFSGISLRRLLSRLSFKCLTATNLQKHIWLTQELPWELQPLNFHYRSPV
jgi:hypothetical protein